MHLFCALLSFVASSKDTEWARWVLIDAQPVETSDAQRKTLVKELDVDTIEWYGGMLANRGDFMRSRGVATSGPEEYEYEEALQFTAAEAAAHFTNNGIALNESMRAPSWNKAPFDKGGKYFTTNVALKWRETIRQGLLRPLHFADCITQDNVGSPFNNGCGCGFDRVTNDRFVAHHTGALPPNFTMASYIQQQRKAGCSSSDMVGDDPLVRSMIAFHYAENILAWRDIYTSLKKAAVEAEQAEPVVYGNVHIIEMVYAVIISQYLDVVWTETPAYLPYVGNPPTWGGPNAGWSALQYKLGRACGNFSKPHWGIVTLTGCALAPAGFKPQTMTATVAAAEAVAGGGVKGLIYGDSAVNDTSFGELLRQ
jgi:hypothetical protein